MLTLHSFSFVAMGSDCSLHLYAANSEDAERISQLVISEISRIEQRYSRYRADSQLSEINRIAAAGGSTTVDDETAGLLNYAFAAYMKSDGLFDITSGLLRKAWDFQSGRLPEQKTIDALLPRIGLDKVIWRPPHLSFNVPGMELDFGGLGKEYAADRAAEVCLANGAGHGIIDLGGDVRVIGPHPDGNAWQIGIRHPRRPGKIMATASIERGALATSGDYERCIEIDGKRYSHILNPKTGWPVHGLCTVTAITERCLVAGSICTLAMLKGLEGIDWLENMGVGHFWMDADGRQGSIGSFNSAD